MSRVSRTVNPAFLMEAIKWKQQKRIRNETLEEQNFSRLDESDDREFYRTDRFVSHLDSVALGTVERIIGDLVIEESPVILDLMAGWDSHIPKSIKPARVVGLGLNENELRKNRDLTEFVTSRPQPGIPIFPFRTIRLMR